MRIVRGGSLSSDGRYGIDRSSPRCVSQLRLARLVHYALQFVLLVLRQLPKPVRVRLVQGIVKGDPLVVGK